MSCWVVPMVAAEMWGVPVEAVLQKARDGQVPSKSENGFMFVDVAPDSPKIDVPRSLRPPRPPTYSVVTTDEMEALHAEMHGEHPAAMPVEDFRTARELTAQLRRPPVGHHRLRRGAAAA
jgi:hypothetical protein